jgi:hypothetical protein
VFLVESMGMPWYLRLYRAQSGSAGDQAIRRISPEQLPKESQWRSYLRREAGRATVVPDSLLVDARIISDDSTGLIAQDGEWYFFLLTNNLVATYAASFTLPPRGIPRLGNRYCFRIKKGVFDEPLGRLPGLQNGIAR